jgi:hypothetical protein
MFGQSVRRNEINHKIYNKTKKYHNIYANPPKTHPNQQHKI